MKINHTIAGSASGLGKTQGGSTPANSGRAHLSAAVSKPDQLQLSSVSKYVRALHSDSAQRSSALAELGATVSAGRYQVDAREVSHKIIEEHLAA